MDLTAYVGSDGAIHFRGRPEFLDGQEGRPLGEGPLVRIDPGEEFEGRPTRSGARFWRLI